MPRPKPVPSNRRCWPRWTWREAAIATPGARSLRCPRTCEYRTGSTCANSAGACRTSRSSSAGCWRWPRIAAAWRRHGRRRSSLPREDSGADARDAQSAIARLQAQIDRQISDYNKRPRRLTYGINAVGVSYARYVEDWATKIERIGTERYPPEARGRIYDSMVITVEIDKHGNVVDVIINEKSRHEVLNRAVRAIVLAGAPYERFPPEMAREGDILQIVRTWSFTNDALATRSTGSP